MALDIFLIVFAVLLYLLLLVSDVRWERTYGKPEPDRSQSIVRVTQDSDTRQDITQLRDVA